MKIERILADKYGPLTEVDWTVPDVSVVYDDNMTGKTSLVDILIRSLFLPRKGSTLFTVPERYEGREEGVEVSLSDGDKTYHFRLDDGAAELQDLLGWEEALFRLLCIRAGDNKLVSERWERSTVMNAVASLVSGARTEKIERVDSDLLDAFGITEGGDWSNRQGTRPPKIKDRIENEILSFLEDFPEIKEELLELEELTAAADEKRSEVEDLEDEAEEVRVKLDLARKLRIEELMERAGRARDELERYSGVDSSLVQKWEDARSKLAGGRSLLEVADYDGYTLRERLKGIVVEGEKKRDRLNSGIDKEIASLRDRLRRLEREKKEGEGVAEERRREENEFVYSEIHRPIAEIRRKREKLENLRVTWNNRVGLGLLFGGLILIGIIFTSLSTPLLGTVGIPGLLGLIWLMGTGRAYNQLSTEIDSLEKKVEGQFNGRYKALLDERVYGTDRIDRLARDLPNTTYKKVREERGLDTVNEELTRLKDRLGELEEEKKELPDEISELEEREEALRSDGEEAVRRIRDARAKLSELRDRTGSADLEELTGLLEEKREVEEEFREAKGLLAGELDGKRRSFEELLEMAQGEIDRLEKEINSSGYSPEGDEAGGTGKLRERKGEVDNQLERKRGELKSLEDDLEEVKTSLRKRGLDPRQPREVFDRRERYLNELEEFTVDRLAGQVARRALERTTSEYVESLDAYLKSSEGEERNVGDLFSEVMGAEFDVEFDFEEGEFLIREGDVQYGEGALSSGGRRHLLYATRLALLDGIPTAPAFLILDDPFLFYHVDRKRKAIGQLKRFVKDGWQVLCFTVDEDTARFTVDELGATRFAVEELRHPQR